MYDTHKSCIQKLQTKVSSCVSGLKGAINVVIYCKFGNFRDNFLFTNSVKRHICDIKKLQLGLDFPTSVNDTVVL